MNYTKPNLTITALGTEYNTSMTSKCMIRVITAQLSKVILTFENWAVITRNLSQYKLQKHLLQCTLASCLLNQD